MQNQRSPSPNQDSSSTTTTTNHSSPSPSPSPPPPPSSRNPTRSESEMVSDGATTEAGGSEKGRPKKLKTIVKIPKHLLKPTTITSLLAEGQGESEVAAPAALRNVPVPPLIHVDDSGEGGVEATRAQMIANAKAAVKHVKTYAYTPNILKPKLPIKRKLPTSSSDVAPAKTYTCCICFDKFLTWKDMFIHIQITHPKSETIPHQGGEGDKKGSSSGSGGFDLNQPVEAQDERNKQPVVAEEEDPNLSGNLTARINIESDDDEAPKKKNKFLFDLNELPPSEDDDEAQNNNP